MEIDPQHHPLPYSLLVPAEQQVPCVLSSPHSGRDYPADFLDQTRLGQQAIRKSEDYYVDELVSSCVEMGMAMISANFPRAFLDVNREPYELDPKMFNGRLPATANTGSARVANGLGTIARIVCEGEEIYSEKFDVATALARIENYYKPYHAALNRLLVETHSRFGMAILIDFHSMPSSSVENTSPRDIDFVLGDRYRSSCSPALTEAARCILRELGFTVTTNKPFAGGFITQHYGRPEHGLHALQIEINRSLYMDEKNIEKSENYSELQDRLKSFLSSMASLSFADFSSATVLAAE